MDSLRFAACGLADQKEVLDKRRLEPAFLSLWRDSYYFSWEREQAFAVRYIL